MFLFGTVYWQERCRTSHRRGRYHYMFLIFFRKTCKIWSQRPFPPPDPSLHGLEKSSKYICKQTITNNSEKNNRLQRSESKFKFFTVCTKLAEMALLYSKDLTTAKQLPPGVLDLMQEIITGLVSQCLSDSRCLKDQENYN